MGRVSSPPLPGCSAQCWPHKVWEPRGVATAQITALATVLPMLQVSPWPGPASRLCGLGSPSQGLGAGGGPEFG